MYLRPCYCLSMLMSHSVTPLSHERVLLADSSCIPPVWAALTAQLMVISACSYHVLALRQAALRGRSPQIILLHNIVMQVPAAVLILIPHYPGGLQALISPSAAAPYLGSLREWFVNIKLLIRGQRSPRGAPSIYSPAN